MKKYLAITVREKMQGMTVEKVLYDYLELTKKQVSRAKFRPDGICKNKVQCRVTEKVSMGDEICICLETDEIQSAQLVLAKIQGERLRILYEDEDVIVVNKPTGMIVHPSAAIYSGTLVNALLYHCHDLSAINGITRPGIVHRIDKETSGLLMVAKNDNAHRSLSKQLEEHSVVRRYVALVHGVINHNVGRIEAPIGRDSKDRKKMAVTSKNAKDAITNFKVLERYDDMTLIECRLETGRTHQIRVHMQYIGHPVYGDPQYGFRNDDNTYGQYLHARVLGFVHPRTNEHMYFEAPLPDFFEEKIKELGGEYNG